MDVFTSLSAGDRTRVRQHLLHFPVHVRLDILRRTARHQTLASNVAWLHLLDEMQYHSQIVSEVKCIEVYHTLVCGSLAIKVQNTYQHNGKYHNKQHSYLPWPHLHD